ncbi:hypothetical protein FXF36_00305 [Pseudobutyrivibrio xylanivorans]|uniref:Hydrolase n=2 Tax=Pseudobutyrivibrio xylanivorans TaxID=185007 RepID=A0A5P6VU44_PSEXY|nr:hypothetical protein FXF36_00305 [Pseudobutyrivibrio xylanivorans]
MYIVFATIKTVEVKYMVFAVDFDGTLSFGKWPECGPANEGLIDFLNKRRQLGDKIILWTCREGANLDLAVEWCQNKGLNFDAVNDNLPDVIEKYGGNSRKVSCDFYIDDRAVSSCVYKLLEA